MIWNEYTRFKKKKVLSSLLRSDLYEYSMFSAISTWIEVNDPLNNQVQAVDSKRKISVWDVYSL